LKWFKSFNKLLFVTLTEFKTQPNFSKKYIKEVDPIRYKVTRCELEENNNLIENWKQREIRVWLGIFF